MVAGEKVLIKHHLEKIMVPLQKCVEMHVDRNSQSSRSSSDLCKNCIDKMRVMTISMSLSLKV